MGLTEKTLHVLGAGNHKTQYIQTDTVRVCQLHHSYIWAKSTSSLEEISLPVIHRNA